MKHPTLISFAHTALLMITGCYLAASLPTFAMYSPDEEALQSGEKGVALSLSRNSASFELLEGSNDQELLAEWGFADRNLQQAVVAMKEVLQFPELNRSKELYKKIRDKDYKAIKDQAPSRKRLSDQDSDREERQRKQVSPEEKANAIEMHGKEEKEGISSKAFYIVGQHFRENPNLLLQRDFLTLRRVAKRMQEKIDSDVNLVLLIPPKFTSVSYFINKTSIGESIRDLIKDAKQEILIGSDQFIEEDRGNKFLDFLLDIKEKRDRDNPIEFKLGIVTTEHKNTSQRLYSLSGQGERKLDYTAIATNQDKSGKMHSKFIVIDGRKVLTGSPNCTYSAHNLNIESLLCIEHRYASMLYKEYYHYIIKPHIVHFDDKSESFKKLKRKLEEFNGVKDCPLKICLAPLLDIKDFIKGQLSDSSIINISMFLVSGSKPVQNDLISALIEKAKKNSTITIKVDQNQYNQQVYMKQALERLGLYKKTVKMFTTLPKRGCMHDKLILLEGQNKKKKVIIGSAGFSKNVQLNQNIENMVMVEDNNTYEFFMEHFNQIEGNAIPAKKF